MTYVKWTFYAVLLAGFSVLLHYSLPSREIVRITGQEVKRQDTQLVSEDGSSQVLTRDVNFVYAVDRNGAEREYRNEDTDMSWPPYFKFDTANVASRAANVESTAADPVWVMVTTYGWRIQVLSMFPNIVSIKQIDEPDTQLIPWFNIGVISVLLIAFLLIRRYIIVLYGRHVDPLVDAVDQQLDEAGDTVATHYRGISGFFRRLFGR
ncbi:MAG: DUF1523 family protein [Pseudomonadota bacterium]